MPVNGQCRLAARPVGLPKPSDWEYAEEPAPEPPDVKAPVREFPEVLLRLFRGDNVGKLVRPL